MDPMYRVHGDDDIYRPPRASSSSSSSSSTSRRDVLPYLSLLPVVLVACGAASVTVLRLLGAVVGVDS